MSLSLCTHARGNTPRRSTSSIRAGRTTVMMAVAMPLVLAYSLGEKVAFATPFSPGVVVAAFAALVVLAGLVVLVGGRAGQLRRRRSGTDECLDWIEQLHVTGSLDAVPGPSAASAGTPDDASAGPEAPHVRALRMQVRALERALEETAVPQGRTEPRQPEQEPGRGLDRVLVTMGALREQVRGDAGAEHVLDRVEAAVTRLGSSRVPGRPALPAPSTRGPAPAPTVAAAATRGPAPRAITPATVAPATAVALPEGPTLSTEVSAASGTSVGALEPEVGPTPPPTDVQRVMPVPAPAPQPVSRGKGWRRRRAA